MRVAILADVHANLEALQACLADALARRADNLVFLGDIVGYGADPEACVDVVRAACAKGARIVMGNHDQAVASSHFKFNESADEAIRWTRAVLSRDAIEFLGALPLTVEEDGRLYVHASAKSPASFPYIVGLREASDSLVATPARLTIVGHVHASALYHIAVTGKVMGFIPTTEVPIPLSSQRRWLAVMGSVGQPRDGNPAAAYALLETTSSEITFVRVPYDVERAAAKIRAAGLPARLWQRLSDGR